MDSLLIYGSYGYTGRLIAREAVSRGGSPVVAGRNHEHVLEQADELGVESRTFDLGEPKSTIERRIEAFDAVLNCAGPFGETCGPLVEACLETGTDYLDITGEFQVFDRLVDDDQRAREAGVTVLPGVGFDVVPTDCLSAFLHARLPSATDLTLGLAGTGSLSRGTARTMVRNLGTGGIVRRNGRLYRVPAAYDTREIDFGRGPTTATTVPWGDVVTAHHSTGIENIAVYAAVPSIAVRAMRAMNALKPIVGSRPVTSTLERLVTAGIDGPDEDERESDEAVVWGEVTDADGRTATARLRTPNPYTLTADTAVSAAQRVLENEAPEGYQTPSTAFGPDFVLDCEGVERELVSAPGLDLEAE
ncbi:saccharopine dehydrogenase NADP-binding domain-containing protein [Halobacteria archaeon AArc-m2/3/4]|uniref:Saccharopine dehydrogenase NADP-binding domain-containing protein n=1 Tax=Natronoglomus mannanivorans TaxID=2979990 RepID=A0AAP2YZW1_9EURY|nr:saccharopine dehydrogenase NADP-binding domain-containing protein [Halobacteria archaeon AArc-xg1-1]MCU4975159.1 saccharopine dehydrogenase NADP-binding domain-containing protein [Halobacteria archaeon AArc-m2/3/4]